MEVLSSVKFRRVSGDKANEVRQVFCCCIFVDFYHRRHFERCKQLRRIPG
jgi:hypothetical protein